MIKNLRKKRMKVLQCSQTIKCTSYVRHFLDRDDFEEQKTCEIRSKIVSKSNS